MGLTDPKFKLVCSSCGKLEIVAKSDGEDCLCPRCLKPMIVKEVISR